MRGMEAEAEIGWMIFLRLVKMTGIRIPLKDVTLVGAKMTDVDLAEETEEEDPLGVGHPRMMTRKTKRKRRTKRIRRTGKRRR